MRPFWVSATPRCSTSPKRAFKRHDQLPQQTKSAVAHLVVARVQRIPWIFVVKYHALLQCSERSLPKQDGAEASGRTFNDALGRDPASDHALLDGINVEAAWREVIDVRSVEGDDVGDQRGGFGQLCVLLLGHRAGSVEGKSG